ncbi:MAG: nucleoside-diphosphate sugar epimerase [Gammaproteobacteria bacterium]|nr:MAG: nucleoside-diphosphate sugar epimerase [Gammaproteobacteria bacterium]
MSNLCLVTGANGHLGNNLVRELLERGETVRAGVRDTHHIEMFKGLDCEIVYTEMQDKEAMLKALKGVDVLYHVAAVFKHWAKDPEAEIIRPNVTGTEIVLEAAAEAKVKKIVYISSVAAVGHNGEPLNESSWNDDLSNAYYSSKIQSEKRAWELAKKHKLWMVSVLPSAMVGPFANRLTDTMQFLESIRNNSLSVNPKFFFNFVDVRDVAKGIYASAIKGKSGNRYILANSTSSSLSEIIEVVKFEGSNSKLPPVLPKWLLYFVAWCLELVATVTGKPAEMIRSQVKLFYGVRQEYDITKARTELGYEPRSSSIALIEAFIYLEDKH